MSEVGTKLDLARAYMDMGDPDGARNILEEVLHEGSAAQKQEAQRLMESLPWIYWKNGLRPFFRRHSLPAAKGVTFAACASRSLRQDRQVGTVELERPPGVLRIAVGIEYDGSAYAGWQAQAAVPTLQQVTERALGRVADEPVSLTCAGRTDAGVHAHGQVAHFDTHAVRGIRGWVLGANSELPADVSVSWAVPVPAHFHARYCAEARTYRYLIANRLARPALLAARSAWIHQPPSTTSACATPPRH